MNKTNTRDSAEWNKMKPKARIKALRSTGSHQDDYKKPLNKMGGSQQDVTTDYVRRSVKKKKEAMAKKMGIKEKFENSFKGYHKDAPAYLRNR